MTTAVVYEPHPLADLMPPMTDGEFARLRDDIAENGLLEPITLHDGRVLDGRHRLRACAEMKVEPTFTQYEGDAPAQFVLSVNTQRRQLSSGRRGMLAVRFLPALKDEARERQGQHLRTAERDSNGRAKSGATAPDLDSKVQGPANRARDVAAKALGISGGTVERARRVTEQAPDLAEKVDADLMTLFAANDEIKRRLVESGEAPAPQAPRTGGGGTPLPVADVADLSGHSRIVANKNRQRIFQGLSTLEGLVEGLTQLNLTNLHHVTHNDEAAHWHRQISHATSALRHFSKALEEANL